MKVQKNIFLAVLVFVFVFNKAFAAVQPPNPNNIEVTVAPTGIILKWDYPAFGYYRSYAYERRVTGGSWQAIPFTEASEELELSGAEDGIGDFVVIKFPISSSQQGLQYRVRGCHQICNNDWSSATAPINVSPYNRNISDGNGNGIRDDAENMATFLDPTKGSQHVYAVHYAYYLQRLLKSSYGPSQDMWIDFANMTHALVCAGNSNVLGKVKSVLLDNENDLARYESAMNAFGNSSWGQRDMPTKCSLQKSNANGLSSYKQPENLQLKELFNQHSTDLVVAGKKLLNANIPGATASEYKYLIFVNGMFNTFEEAKASEAHLRNLIDQQDSRINVRLIYNSKVGFIKDLREVGRQYLNQPNSNESQFIIMSDIDDFLAGRATQVVPSNVFLEHMARIDYQTYRDNADLQTLREAVDTRLRLGDIILMGHSQGNFFVNQVWSEVNARTTGDTGSFLRVVGLGTPANFIPNNYHYYTNTGDKVMNAIRSFGPIKPLPANITITGGDFLGHGFIETYMPAGKSHTLTTVSTITRYFIDMDNREEEEQNNGCRYASEVGNGGKRFTYNPNFVFENVISTITFRRDSRLPPNSRNRYKIFDKSNRLILSTSYEYGVNTSTFNYDYRQHGLLTVEVESDLDRFQDNWNVSLYCNN